MKYLLLLLILSGCITCSLEEDVTNAPWVSNNFLSAHMQYLGGNYSGLLPVTLVDNQPLPRSAVSIKLFYTGSINVFSRACELNYSDRYDGDYLFPITKMRNCDISFVVSPDQWKNTNHGIVISGKIITYVRKSTDWGLLINGDINQHAIQVVEGTPSKYEVVNFKTYSDSGMLIGVCSNGIEISKEYNNNGATQLLLSELQNASNSSNTCQFKTIPYGSEPSATGNLIISVFTPIIPIERIRPEVRGKRLEWQPAPHIMLTIINGKAYTTKNISIKYDPNKEYNISQWTIIGRNSSIIYKGGNIIWSSN